QAKEPSHSEPAEGGAADGCQDSQSKGAEVDERQNLKAVHCGLLLGTARIVGSVRHVLEPAIILLNLPPQRIRRQGARVKKEIIQLPSRGLLPVVRGELQGIVLVRDFNPLV